MKCNSGSALDIASKGSVAINSAIVTTLGASSGCLGALLYALFYYRFKKNETTWDLMSALNGTLAGLVSITAGCGVIKPWAGIVQGSIGGVLYFHASRMLAHTFRIDDPVDGKSRCSVVHPYLKSLDLPAT